MKIVSCAIKTPCGCIISMERPNRHHNIINAYEWSIEGTQGFLTDEGTFVDRYEALEIAKNAGQVGKFCGGDDWQLYSENLW